MGLSRNRLSAAKVLIVNESDECREVLSTVLQNHGFDTIEAAEPSRGLQMLVRHHPGLVVLDSDSDSAQDASMRGEYDRQTRAQDAQLLVLGRATCPAGMLRGDQVIAKPYHFGPLIRTIELLLER